MEHFHVELKGETGKRFVRAFGNKDLNVEGSSFAKLLQVGLDSN